MFNDSNTVEYNMMTNAKTFPSILSIIPHYQKFTENADKVVLIVPGGVKKYWKEFVERTETPGMSFKHAYVEYGCQYTFTLIRHGVLNTSTISSPLPKTLDDFNRLTLDDFIAMMQNNFENSLITFPREDEKMKSHIMNLYILYLQCIETSMGVRGIKFITGPCRSNKTSPQILLCAICSVLGVRVTVALGPGKLQETKQFREKLTRAGITEEFDKSSVYIVWFSSKKEMGALLPPPTTPSMIIVDEAHKVNLLNVNATTGMFCDPTMRQLCSTGLVSFVLVTATNVSVEDKIKTCANASLQHYKPYPQMKISIDELFYGGDNTKLVVNSQEDVTSSIFAYMSIVMDMDSMCV